MEVAIEPTLIGVLIAGAIALFGVFANHRLAIHRDHKNARRTASIKFREIFLRDLHPVYPVVTKWPENVDGYFRHIFPSLQLAVTEFRPFLSWSEKRRFDKAWLTYYAAYLGDHDSQCYHHYHAFYEPGKETHEQATERVERDLYANVSRLLAFAI